MGADARPCSESRTHRGQAHQAAAACQPAGSQCLLLHRSTIYSPTILVVLVRDTTTRDARAARARRRRRATWAVGRPRAVWPGWCGLSRRRRPPAERVGDGLRGHPPAFCVPHRCPGVLLGQPASWQPPLAAALPPCWAVKWDLGWLSRPSICSTWHHFSVALPCWRGSSLANLRLPPSCPS